MHHLIHLTLTHLKSQFYALSEKWIHWPECFFVKTSQNVNSDRTSVSFTFMKSQERILKQIYSENYMIHWTWTTTVAWLPPLPVGPGEETMWVFFMTNQSCRTCWHNPVHYGAPGWPNKMCVIKTGCSHGSMIHNSTMWIFATTDVQLVKPV